MDEEQVRRMLVQIETGKKQMEQLGKQAQMVESAIIETQATIEALNSLSQQKPGTEMMVQVGSGAFIRVTIKDVDNILVGIGAGMSVEKKLPEAVETLEARKTQLSASFSSVQRTMGELGIKLAELNSTAEQMMGGMHE
jgi:prefoldin alpha subunit